jgi:hypothetical protein
MLAHSWAVILLFLRIRFFILSTFLSLLLPDGYVMHGVLTADVTPLFNLENHSKTCVLPIFCSPDTTISIFSCFCSSLPQFKAKFVAGKLFFQVYKLLGKPKSQMEQHTLVLNKTLLNNHTCYSHISCREGFSKLSSVCT